MAVATEREYGLFIAGEFAEPASGEVRELREPASGELLARAAMANEVDVDRAVDAARAALDGPWAKTPPDERSRLLHALADAIVANRKELADLEARNVGKAISSVKAEISGAVEHFRFFASAIASIAGRSNPIGGSLLFYSQKEPVGVFAQIVLARLAIAAFGRRGEGSGSGLTKFDTSRKLGSSQTHPHASPPRPRSASRRESSTSFPVTVRRPARTSCGIRASTGSRSPARPRRAARSCGSAPTRSSG